MCLEGDAPKKAELYLIQIFLSPLLCHNLPQPNMSTSQVTPPLPLMRLLTCVNPSLIRLCLKVLANFSSSSRSLGSSDAPDGVRCFATCKCWGTSRWGSTDEPGSPERPTACWNNRTGARSHNNRKAHRFLCHLPSTKQRSCRLVLLRLGLCVGPDIGASYLWCQAGSRLGEEEAALLLREGEEVGLQSWGEKQRQSWSDQLLHQLNIALHRQDSWCSEWRVSASACSKYEHFSRYRTQTALSWITTKGKVLLMAF